MGNGAIIVEVPDAPLGLADDVQYTSDTIIAFTWNNGISQGGSTIIDYKITYDQAIGTYTTLAEGVVPMNYQTTITLTPGATYRFRVQARNSVGFSLPSSEVAILAARVPD